MASSGFNVFSFPEQRARPQGTTVSSTAFGGQLQGARGEPARATYPLVPGAQPSKMRAMGNGERQLIFNRNFQVGTGALANQLRGHQVPRDDSQPNSMAPQSSYGDLGNSANNPVPVVRMLRALKMQNLPGIRDWCFIHKPLGYGSARMARAHFPQTPQPNSQAVAGHTPWGDMGLNAMQLAMNHKHTDYDFVDAWGVEAAHIRFLNYVLFIWQLKLFKEDIEAYERLNPGLIWDGADNGDEKYNVCGWSLDGCVRLEEARGGQSTRTADGLGPSRGLGPNMPFGGGIGAGTPATKVVSVVRAGQAQALDLFGSRGTWTGSLQYFVLTKTDKVPKDGNYAFYLTVKAGTAEQNPNAVKTVVQCGPEVMDPANKMANDPKYNDVQKALYKAMKHGFRPFQLHAVTSADGGTLHAAYYEYETEWGIRRYDARRMCPARTLFEPWQGTIHAAITDPSHSGYVPSTNGIDTMARMPFPGVLIFPDKNGALDAL